MSRYLALPVMRGGVPGRDPSGLYGVWDNDTGRWVTAQNMWREMAENTAAKLNAGWYIPVTPPRPVLVFRNGGGWWPAHLCRWERRTDHRGDLVWWGLVAVDATGDVGWHHQRDLRPAIDDIGTTPPPKANQDRSNNHASSAYRSAR